MATKQQYRALLLSMSCFLFRIMQMQEVSLRANLMQAKQRIDLGLGRRRGPATPTPAIATSFSGWCF